jgi:hypothetical protein
MGQHSTFSPLRLVLRFASFACCMDQACARSSPAVQDRLTEPDFEFGQSERLAHMFDSGDEVGVEELAEQLVDGGVAAEEAGDGVPVLKRIQELGSLLGVTATGAWMGNAANDTWKYSQYKWSVQYRKYRDAWKYSQVQAIISWRSWLTMLVSAAAGRNVLKVWRYAAAWYGRGIGHVRALFEPLAKGLSGDEACKRAASRGAGSRMSMAKMRLLGGTVSTDDEEFVEIIIEGVLAEEQRRQAGEDQRRQDEEDEETRRREEEQIRSFQRAEREAVMRRRTTPAAQCQMCGGVGPTNLVAVIASLARQACGRCEEWLEIAATMHRSNGGSRIDEFDDS